MLAVLINLNCNTDEILPTFCQQITDGTKIESQKKKIVNHERNKTRNHSCSNGKHLSNH